MSTIYLKCVREGSKLRVRITSPGYNNQANCQFPRAIRSVGKKYSVPPEAITFARGPAGKFFYRIKKNLITVLDYDTLPPETKVNVDRIYEDENADCVVCMDASHEVVIVPCGHFCMCKECANILQNSSGKCPMCRGDIHLVVGKDQIQT
jgi:uncharacterized protein YggU (UPF0235/DUF167 family)